MNGPATVASMPAAAPIPGRVTSERFFDLVGEGVLRADDRVELLEGVIVSMAPQDARHASATTRTETALQVAIGQLAVIRTQLPLVTSETSTPEPDVAVVPGSLGDYDRAHPRRALLVVEVAGSSLSQDRLTKAAIYAAAGVPEYWVVNLERDIVEVFRDPDVTGQRYRTQCHAVPGDSLDLVAFSGAGVQIADLIPAR